MRVIAIIVAAVATVAVDIGVFLYWIGTDLSCLDSCPEYAGFLSQWLNGVVLYLGPGIVLSLIASLFAILSLAIKRRSIALVVAIVALAGTAIAIVLIMHYFAGSFTPLAAPLSDATPDDILVSRDWLTATTFAAIPLVFWPLTTFFAVLVSEARK